MNTAVRAVLEAHPGVKQELSGLVAAFSWIKRNLNCIDDKFKGEKASHEHISGCCASLLRKIEMQEQAFFGAVRALALSSEPSVEDLVSLRDHCSNAVKNSATRCKITSWVASGNDKNVIYVTAGGSTSHSSTPTSSDDFNIRIGASPSLRTIALFKSTLNGLYFQRTHDASRSAVASHRIAFMLKFWAFISVLSAAMHGHLHFAYPFLKVSFVKHVLRFESDVVPRVNVEL